MNPMLKILGKGNTVDAVIHLGKYNSSYGSVLLG